MFKLTPAAEAVLTSVRDQSGKPDTYGVRFFASEQPLDQGRLAFDFVEAPAPDDRVEQGSSLDTYVAADVSEMVGDAIVDIETVGDEQGLVLRRPGPGDGLAS